MRIVALALGVLAGLVASLALALGLLDTDIFPGTDPKYVAFGLSLIPSIAILSAGIAIAAPAVGAILMVLAALLWAAASLLLKAPPFWLVMPPVLLLLGAAAAFIGFLRRPQERVPVPRLDLGASEAVTEPPSASRMFEAEPDLRADPVPALSPLSEFEQSDDLRPDADGDWRPGKRRPAPPRQEPVFRDPEPEFEEEYESGFARFARSVSGVLSFGLYAALAGAAVLIYFNLRTDEPPTSSAVQVAEAAPVLSSAPPTPSSSASSQPAPSSSSSQVRPVAPSSAPAARDLSSIPLSGTETGDTATADTLTAPLRQVGPESTVFAEPEAAASSASFETTSSSSIEPVSSEVPVQLQPENLLADASKPSPLILAAPTADSSALTVAGPGEVMPFTMPPLMAVERTEPSPGPTAAPPAAPQADTTGL